MPITATDAALLLFDFVLVGFGIYLDRRWKSRDKEEKTQRENLVLIVEQKIAQATTALTSEIRKSHDVIVAAVNAEYVRKELFLPLRADVAELKQRLTQHESRITRIEATHETGNS